MGIGGFSVLHSQSNEISQVDASLECVAKSAYDNPLQPLSAALYTLEQFKHDREIFIAAMHDREMKIRDINSLFKTAVDKANSDARTAMSTASTPLQKSTIFSNRRNAIDAAINARDLAITALGAMPIPPTQPLRQPKTMGNNKSNAGQNH
jgi:hypothetical protein